MAFEQLKAYRAGRALAELGEVERLAPDDYPMLVNSPLRPEHLDFCKVLVEEESNPRTSRRMDSEPGPTLKQIFDAGVEHRTRIASVIIERLFAQHAGLTDGHASRHLQAYAITTRILATLIDKGIDFSQLAVPILEWASSFRFGHCSVDPVRRVAIWAARIPRTDWPDGLAEALSDVYKLFCELNYAHQKEAQKMLHKVVGEGAGTVLVREEIWAAEAITELEKESQQISNGWYALFRHCATATGARPSAKWLKTGRSLLEPVGLQDFSKRLKAWFPRVDAGRFAAPVNPHGTDVDVQQRMHEINALVLRGLLWLSADAKDPHLTRAVAKLALSAYRKIRGIGPRSPKVGNACVYALSEAKSEDAVGQLAILKVRVKFGTAQKEIGKAFDAAAAAMNIPRDEIEEMGIPSYGMEEVGYRREAFGDFVAELRVDGRDVEMSWSDSAGKPRKSVPAKVKSDCSEEFKELKAAAKDIAAMLPTQADRLDSMFLARKQWTAATWRERYLNHPLVGTVARRLIWMIEQDAANVAAIYRNGVMVNAEDEPIDVATDAKISLWHPINQSVEHVLAWREWLEKHKIRQPFKQAHREVYILTDAERATNTYSNRFAAHVVRQHQFNALCAARGWKNRLRLMVDDSYPPASRDLRQWGLRAEYWIEGAGDIYGTDTAESGAYLRLATDQVRFYRTDAALNFGHAFGGGYTISGAEPGQQNANEPLPLDQIPPLVLSEVMRDVDLFVGVASVGNDPTWQDGGPEGRYRTYWHTFSFGELSATADTRKGVLSRLIPRLKIADRCSLADRFLVVRGNLRTYKIHLGSGNILMEPNDQYLCIVPSRGDKTENLFLPFEGDSTLSVIISKAFLLAADDKIKDTTITRQIAP